MHIFKTTLWFFQDQGAVKEMVFLRPSFWLNHVQAWNVIWSCGHGGPWHLCCEGGKCLGWSFGILLSWKWYSPQLCRSKYSKCTSHPSRPHSTQVNQALKSLGQNVPLRLVKWLKCSLPWQGWEGTWRLQSRHISIDILAKFNGAFSQCLS